MAANSDQTSELFVQIKEHFTSHPVVSITQPESDSPDQYEIVYSLPGLCKDSNGKIVEATDHTIELTIPFGFPHFPPSCKPKSNIFHPDFDPAAICLGEFWEQGRTIPELIIYIGKMINGEIYSTSNAFNEEAATWYKKNNSTFPFSNIQWGSTNASASESSESQEIDILDDADLSSGFDYLSLENNDTDDEISLDTSFADQAPPEDFDYLLLERLEDQKKYNKILETLGKVEHSTTRSAEFSDNAKNAVQKAQRVRSAAKKDEDKGNTQKALDGYQQAANIVSDFYGIAADITRAKQTLNLLNDFAPGTTSAKEKVTPVKDKPQISQKETPKKRKKTPARKISADDSFLNDIGSPSRLPLYIAAAVLLCIAISGGYFYYSFSTNLNKARESYTQCTTALDKNSFSAAKKFCNTALLLSDNVKFIHQQEVNTLRQNITTTIKQERFIQGLAGNILVNGHYYSQSDGKELIAINKVIEQAEEFYFEKEWHQAKQLFSELLPRVQKNKHLDNSFKETIRTRYKQVQFRVELNKADDLFKRGQWDKARESYSKTLQMLSKLSPKEQVNFSDKLKNSQQKAEFNALKTKGDHFFAQSDWDNAVLSYEQALEIVKNAKISSTEVTLQIQENTKKAELYLTISRGNKSFATGAWDKAITEYSQAGSFLAKHQALLSQTDSAINRKKLFRIILQASIIRERQNVRKKLETNNLTDAKKSYEMILSMISHSDFSQEDEFLETNNEMAVAIKELDHKILLQKKIQYLKKNFQHLFAKNYPATSPESLTKPAITLSKEEPGKFIFKMQCSEVGRGRPLTLVMYYAYNLDNHKWSFYYPNQ